MKLLNRSALVLLPRQPFADWVASLDTETSGLEAPLSLADHRREGRVYLVPEAEDANAFEALLDSCWRPLLENELGAWDGFGDHWPAPLERALFDAWFEVRPQLLCFDAADRPLLVAALETS